MEETPKPSGRGTQDQGRGTQVPQDGARQLSSAVLLLYTMEAWNPIDDGAIEVGDVV